MTKSESAVREAIDAQNRRLKSDDPQQRVVAAFFRCGEVGSHLSSLTDRQIGQLVFDVVWDELGLVSPALSICIEAIERLFRSPAGARPEGKRFNDINNLPACPVCEEDMLHYVGIDEPDYDQCSSVTCGHKVPKGEQHFENSPTPRRLFDLIIGIIDQYIHVDTAKEHNE